MEIRPEARARFDNYAKALSGEAGQVPVLAQMNEHVPLLYGADFRQYYTDPELFVAVNLAVYQYYGVDLPGFYYDIYNIEAEALGQRLTWEPDRMPDVDRTRPLIREQSDLDHLRAPDMRRVGRTPFALEAMRRAYDLGVPARLRFCSPFSLAANVRGFEALLMDCLLAPEFAHRLLRFLTDEVLTPWVVLLREATGNPRARATGADAGASPPIVSLPILEEFVFPYVKRLDEQAGRVSGVGYWGYSCLADRPAELRRMLALMAVASPGLLMCVDPDVAVTGPEPYVDFAVEKDTSLMLGLDTVLLQDGPVERIVERCRRYVEAGSKAKRLVMFLNDVSVNTLPEHVHTAVAAIRHYAAQPATTFRPPPVESFAAFMAKGGGAA